MAPLSPSGLAGYLVFGILLNLLLVVGAYIWHHKQRKDGKKGINVTFGEKMHGAFRWILFALIAVCWIFSVFATASCQFLEVTLPEGKNNSPILFGFGFVQYYLPAAISAPGECVGFASDITSKKYFQGNHPAFTFAIANCFLTTVCWLGIIAIQFFLRTPHLRHLLWLVMRVSMYCSTWCCVCTFYVQEQAVCYVSDCSLGEAGVIQVFNFLLLIICSILLFLADDGDETAFDKCRTKTTVVRVRVPAGTLTSQV